MTNQQAREIINNMKELYPTPTAILYDYRDSDITPHSYDVGAVACRIALPWYKRLWAYFVGYEWFGKDMRHPQLATVSAALLRLNPGLPKACSHEHNPNKLAKNIIYSNDSANFVRSWELLEQALCWPNPTIYQIKGANSGT